MRLRDGFGNLVTVGSSSGAGITDDTKTIAKATLKNKVWIALGDSFTAGMASLLTAKATEYSMVVDNRGIVSSSICGTYDTATGNGTGFKPMWKRADEIVSDYSGGYAINGTTYSASDVGVISFMGGANDAWSEASWIGANHLKDLETDHIYGALHHIFEVLQKAFPNARFVVVTQPNYYHNAPNQSATDDTILNTWKFSSVEKYKALSNEQLSSITMRLKQKAVIDVAEAHQLPYTDLNATFPTVYKTANQTKYWQSDKLHLTADGYQLCVDAFEETFLRTFI